MKKIYIIILAIVLHICICCLIILKKKSSINFKSKVSQKIIDKYRNNFDIIVTWVDYSNKKYNEETKKAGGSSMNVKGEFKELKYLIRSLLKHNIEFRNIYIVHSDNHPPPKYLVKNNPRLFFVPHSKIVKNKSDLPLIHRESITINLHRIPGLLNNYFYFEDDMFIHHPNIIYKQLEFYENKKQIVFTIRKPNKKLTNPEITSGLWRLGWVNSNKIFDKFKKDNIIFWEDHNIWFYNKKIVEEIENKYEKYFTNTSSYQDIKKCKKKEKYYVSIQNVYNNYLIHKLNFEPIKNQDLVNSVHSNSKKYEVKGNKITKNTIPKLLKDMNNYKYHMFSNLQGPGISDEYTKIPKINKIFFKWLNKLYKNKTEFEI